MQNNSNRGDRYLTLFVTIVCLLFEIIINEAANEKRKATYINLPPEGSKLNIFDTAKNNKEKPNNFLF